jgi:hypothetical protein
VGTQLASVAGSDVVEVVVKAIQRAEDPLIPSKIRQGLTGPYRLPDERLRLLLDELTAQGRVHRFDPSRKGGSPRYWTGDLEQYARQAMLRRLSVRPMTSSELKRALKATLRGLPDKRLDQIHGELQRDGAICELPKFPGARVYRFSTRGPDPRDYVQDALQKIYKALAKAGVTRRQVDEAAQGLLLAGTPFTEVSANLGGPLATTGATGQARPLTLSFPPDDEDLGQRILERMTLDSPAAANGALVSLSDLRRSMEFQDLDKTAFDQAVLHLAGQGRVALHRHDFPASLSDEEKAEMVPDGRGGYYIGIAQRI